MALTALFTGASGLAANSSALDVVGNNLANLNTTGFKTQRALFQDAVYQTLSSGSAAATSGRMPGDCPEVSWSITAAEKRTCMNVSLRESQR